jgi:hypothetical protein
MSVELMVGKKDKCFHCIGFGVLDGIGSVLWLVVTCYALDSGVLTSSLLLAV